MGVVPPKADPAEAAALLAKQRLGFKFVAQAKREAETVPRWAVWVNEDQDISTAQLGKLIDHGFVYQRGHLMMERSYL